MHGSYESLVSPKTRAQLLDKGFHRFLLKRLAVVGVIFGLAYGFPVVYHRSQTLRFYLQRYAPKAAAYVYDHCEFVHTKNYHYRTQDFLDWGIPIPARNPIAADA